VQNATKPDPKNLWDIRPLLKKALVEAPGIEGRWREVGFGGSRGVSFAKSGKKARSAAGEDSARSVSESLAESGCSNVVRRLSRGIEALDRGELGPARVLLVELLAALGYANGSR
jgi:hypothetical protein